VVGFDDLPMSGWVSPPLTTIIQPLAPMAAMATRTILALLDGRSDTSSNRVELTTSLVVRASTAPPRKKTAGRGAANAGSAGTRSVRRSREVRSS
jgi:DNA-binding LacI/PurR family transcriptional regulator